MRKYRVLMGTAVALGVLATVIALDSKQAKADDNAAA